MKTNSLLLAGLMATLLFPTALALTTERVITPDYIRQHPGEFSVSAARGLDGLIVFTISHTVAAPMYHVAHLTIHHHGKLMATSNTPVFGRKRDNTFHFSIAADAVAESKFSLSDSALDSTGEVPLPGTVIHHFRPADFVPKELLKQPPGV